MFMCYDAIQPHKKVEQERGVQNNLTSSSIGWLERENKKANSGQYLRK